jgi:hypothetical protein
MPKYAIERDIPGIGNATADEVRTISQKSCSVLNNLGPSIQWLQSYGGQDLLRLYGSQRRVGEHARLPSEPRLGSRAYDRSHFGGSLIS